MPGSLLETLKGKVTSQRPVWLMRQAGRYLPEYRELRAEKGGFLDLVYDSAAAAEVTLQPIRRFGFEGAILFSDILIVPYGLGYGLTFEEGEQSLEVSKSKLHGFWISVTSVDIKNIVHEVSILSHEIGRAHV